MDRELAQVREVLDGYWPGTGPDPRVPEALAALAAIEETLASRLEGELRREARIQELEEARPAHEIMVGYEKRIVELEERNSTGARTLAVMDETLEGTRAQNASLWARVKELEEFIADRSGDASLVGRIQELEAALREAGPAQQALYRSIQERDKLAAALRDIQEELRDPAIGRIARAALEEE